ncbi:MAG: SDR family NAD(P)-dependent oxidoreductase [Gemmatimonadota bacterium]
MSPTLLGITPFQRPDPELALALCRAGALGAVDLGRDPAAALAALAPAIPAGVRGLGVRIHAGAEPPPAALPARVEFVVLPAGADPAAWRPRRVYIQVTSIDDARAAEAAGADAVIAVGAESGGRVGEETAYILLQRCAAEIALPIWVQGGIGLHTAAACLAGGAAGVVLDSQLALLEESSVPAPAREAIRRMDGTETAVVSGHRIFVRPDLPAAALAADADPAIVCARLGGDDLHHQLLPAGQDAAFARGLADRFRTAAGVVEGFRHAIGAHLAAARTFQPLAPGAPLATAHGTRYPILQGPMTRVSDRAAFAETVAEGGGLPFLALSLLTGTPLRDLLTETSERLAGRPWGVGILGFVPAALRAEQLEVVAAARPPFALIAGGRPSQARELERHGIVTYLHVPTPGLLELFLKQGARRFVFEGRECGGHVGPLSSFVLWESQVERLLAFEHPDELAVVFAGGIHDARSAAMVAALAAPLAARGARIGILMGTGYLFTKEIVATEAIVAGYQETALACEATALLETGPGHATRCVDTPFAGAFRVERQRLEASGASRRAVWATLERMNLGRLRIASRGLRREGAELIPLDAPTQRQDGMYMIGQAAALRDAVGTIGALHEDVTVGATRRLAALNGAEEVGRPAPVAASPPAGPPPADIAIIGMACVFPGATDLDTYWHNIVEGIDSITEVPPERWDPALYYDPDGAPGRTTPSKWGGFLDEIVFDPTRYGIPPRSLSAIDAVQLLSLEVAQRALADAGYADRPFDRDRAAVIFGAEGGTDLSKAYGFRALYPQYAGALPEALDAELPVPTEDSFPGVLTNVISGRIANRLDLGGENYTVNAACASSLASLSIGAQWLAAGTCDLVVVGGADVHNSIGDFLMFSSVHALSRSGRCRTFDRSADGITIGEGVGAVIVKRLADAERDGDRIYAVVKGIAGSSDGRSLGLTAPRREGQVRALSWAYRAAGVSPADVGLLEAHGTGTVVGDRTELESMTEVFTTAGAAVGTCALSAVKSQIGHLKAAAGVASLIKVALCLHHRVLPPTLHIAQPNAGYDATRSPFTLNNQAQPWIAPRRVAGVSAFGFGGTNYHAVLEAAAGAAGAGSALDVWPAELFLLRGADRHAAGARAAKLAARLSQRLASRPAYTLRELAQSTSCGGEGPVQLAFVARDADDLAALLAGIAGGRPDAERVVRRAEAAEAAAEPPGHPGRIAFLYPGQGSQYVGMLRDVFVAFPMLGTLLAREPAVAARMFPPQAFTPAERAAQDAALTATDVAQVALGLADLAMARVLERLGLHPDMRAGHSYGEMVALSEAGAWGAADLLQLSRARALAILDAAGDDPGAMAAVTASGEEIAPHLAGLEDIALANRNAPRQTILSGPTPSIESAIARCQAAGLSASRLPVACAFHSAVVAGARDTFGATLAQTAVAPLREPVWSNTTAAPYPVAPDAVRAQLAEQLARPVRFAEQIEAMYAAGARVFVEIGPGRVLTGLVGRNLGARPHVAIATDVKGVSGLVQLQTALAQVAVAGVAFDPAVLFAGRGAAVPDLDALPDRALAPTAWLVNGHYARPAEGPIPAGALRPVTPGIAAAVRTIPVAAVAWAAADAPTAEQAVVEYLRNMRELIEAQRQVMLGYLGVPTGAPTGTPVGAAIGAPQASPVPAAVAPATQAAAPEPTVAPAAIAAPELSLSEALLAIVSERTGYPRAMLDADLDLEADLSIDSIKRIEILGALNETMGLAARFGNGGDDLVEELAGVKTLRGIETWISERLARTEPAETEPAETEPAETEPAMPAADAAPLGRYRLEVQSAPPAVPNGVDVRGRTFALTEDGRGVATALAALLRARGAEVRLAPPGSPLGAVDGLIHLAPLAADGGPDDVKALFRLAKEAVGGGAHWVLGVTGMGGGFGQDANGHGRAGQGGIAGFLKSLKKEWPDKRVRAVDLDPHEAAGALATHLYAELVADDDRIEVAYAGGERRALAVVQAARPEPASEALLDQTAVVLVTGGARGITAHISIALAQRYGCALELVGRTPLLDEPESAATADCADLISLRRQLAATRPDAPPAEIEFAARRITATREIRDTLRAIAQTGSRVRYHAVDVRDEPAFGALIEDVYARHGRLDGVIHAAGLIEDKLLVHKSAPSFDRVFDTKVQGALTLARALRAGTRFVAYFSSVASVFGNRGQTDYAAANDVLDKLAWHLNGRGATRVVSVAWGPWDTAGMVSPALRSEYARRGIRLIPLAEGAASLIDELALGAQDPAQVVLMAAPPPGWE